MPILTRSLSKKTVRLFRCSEEQCGCPEGVFIAPSTVCQDCKHEMDFHSTENHVAFPVNCPWATKREALVQDVLGTARTYGVAIIRGPPKCGKSSLLRLIGHHVLTDTKHQDLEPVWIDWTPACNRPWQTVNVDSYFASGSEAYSKINSRVRSVKAQHRLLFLIDEGQLSFDEPEFWNTRLKSHNLRSQPLYIIAMLHGMALTRARFFDDAVRLNHTQMFSTAQKFELESGPSKSGLLLNRDETNSVLASWACETKLELQDDVREYLHMATNGYAGILGSCLSHIGRVHALVKDKGQQLTVRDCHACVVSIAKGLSDMPNWGRGLWTKDISHEVRRFFRQKRPPSVSFPSLVASVRQLAETSTGIICNDNEQKGLATAHQLGLVQARLSVRRDGQEQIKYEFASDIHRRVAYAEIAPSLNPHARYDVRNLKAVCIDSLKQMRASAIANRSNTFNQEWVVPEAAFRDEFYRCLVTLHGMRVMPEFSHTSLGRLDFYIDNKNWGIELMQNGSKQKIAEHIARFTPGGKYHKWQILEDWMLLSFCPENKIRNLHISHAPARDHIFQIAYAPEKARLMIHDWKGQLSETIILGVDTPGPPSLDRASTVVVGDLLDQFYDAPPSILDYLHKKLHVNVGDKLLIEGEGEKEEVTFKRRRC